MKNPLPKVEPVDQPAILGWMDELGRVAKSSSGAELLDFDGVDVLDVLLVPIYLSVLGAVRSGATNAAAPGVVGRLRRLGWRLKLIARARLAAQKTSAPDVTDILFWPRELTHLKFMLPVAQAADRRGNRCRMLTCQAKQFQRMQSVVAQPVYAQGAWPAVVREARREGARRAGQLALVAPWPVSNTLGGTADLARIVRDTVTQFLPLASDAIANARSALDAFQPKLLVVGNDLTLEGRAGCRVAAAGGVLTATFMHGSISGNAMQGRHCVDRLLVYSNSHKQSLVQQGVSAERVVVCGAPYLDERPRQSGQIHPALQARLGLRPGEPWILVATSGPGHSVSHQHHQVVIDAIARLCDKFTGVPIVVKLHRKDHPSYYQRALAGRTGGNVQIVRADARGYPGDIFAWLQGCRVVLTGASTVAVEAMLMDVPVITMDFCNELHDIDFIDAGATLHVTTPEALERTVHEVLAGREPSADLQSRVRAYLEDAFFALDGQSANRGAEALGELFEHRPAPSHGREQR